jgi:hypothetical protein
VKEPSLRVVVDGSNLATEGRTIPNLVQLDDAVRAFLEEYPGVDVIVVVDASFEHRVAASERARFKEAEVAGEIVTPPAGAVGRGDAFILKIAQRIDAVVLSNDSFQEFHEQYPWLFDPGRLIGGKPVKGVGWVFTERIPVRGIKSVRATRAVKKVAVALPDGVVPAIGDTLTPVKSARASKRPAPKEPAEVKVTAVVKAAKKASPPSEPKAVRVREPKEATDVPEAPTTSKASRATKKAPAAKKSVKKMAVAATSAPLVGAATSTSPRGASDDASATAPAPTVALRRGRQPVNPEARFSTFVKQHKIGSALAGEVVAFTSHGAVIKVTMKNGDEIECYAPTTSLGDPAPARARDVLKRGDKRTFRLLNVDGERRIAELGLS